MSDTIGGFRNRFIKWKEAYQSKVLKVSLWKARVMASGALSKMVCLRVNLTHVGSVA